MKAFLFLSPFLTVLLIISFTTPAFATRDETYLPREERIKKMKDRKPNWNVNKQEWPEKHGNLNQDELEDIRDKREDVRDAKQDGEKKEDHWDHREDKFDKREDRWGRNHDPNTQ